VSRTSEGRLHVTSDIETSRRERLPAGLERYTGEQSFDLVAVNATTAVTSMAIPYPWGGSYTVSLQPGINNLLFPREQFLHSSFAAGVLEGQEFPYPSGNPTPPILSEDPTAQGLLTQSFGDASSPMTDLEAYWQNRSIASGPGNFSSLETGVSSTSSLQVRTLLVPSTPSNNTGSLPSHPSTYSAAGLSAPPALQAILTLNVTSSATLDLLLAALLTNTSGGVNGTFQGVTGDVASLGLPTPVLSALANAPFVSEGLYGPPPYTSTPPSGGAWGALWNAAGAVTRTLAGAIVSVVGVVWSVEVAADNFLDRLPVEAAALAGEIVARTAAAIVRAGQAIANALKELLNWLNALVKDLLSPVFSPVVLAMDQYTLHLASDLEQAYNDSNMNRSIAQDAARLWSDASEGVFLFVEGIVIAITVALTILQGFSLGAGFLLPIVTGLVMSGSMAALAIGGGPSLFTDFENLNPISPALANEWGAIFDPPEYLATLGQILGIGTTAWAAQSIETAWENKEVPEWTDEAGLAVGIVGLITAGVAGVYSSSAGAVASLLFDGSSAAIDVYSLLNHLSIENAVVAVMDGATVAIDAHTLGLPI